MIFWANKIETQHIENKLSEDGIVETVVEGMKLFRVSKSIPCAPAIYECIVVAILSGSKEAIFDDKRHVYDSSQYLYCSISMPIKAGTLNALPDNLLLGVYISLDTKVMSELAIEIETEIGSFQKLMKVLCPKALHSLNGMKHSPILCYYCYN